MRYYYHTGKDYTSIKIIAWLLSVVIGTALVIELFGDPFAININRRNQRIEYRRRMEANDEENDFEFENSN